MTGAGGAESLPRSSVDDASGLVHEPATTVLRTAPTAVVNALSVDVEDYFQVAAFEDVVRREDWDRYEPRVERNTRQLLQLFQDYGVRATFFTLGWVAERSPELVREIVDAGHELAAHGYDHRQVTVQTPAEFRHDVRRTKRILEDISGVAVLGYRAPSYSIVRSTLWALEVLAEEGYRYDTSIFPIHHDRYGIPDFPRFPWIVKGANGGSLHEFPPATVRLMGLNFPIGGGGYLRHFPLAFIRWGIRHLNRVERRSALLYVHPWEIDPEQPRQPVGWLTRVRHYGNLTRTRRRLARLLGEFRFVRVRELLGL